MVILIQRFVLRWAGMVILALTLGMPAMGMAQAMAQFGDWQTWCDNLRKCTAAVEKTESALIVTREGEPMSPPNVELHLNAFGSERELEPLRLKVNGSPVRGIGVIVSQGRPNWHAPLSDAQTSALVRGIVNAPLLEVQTKHAGRYIISLKGLAAALLWIDDQQGRVGTVTALVAKGNNAAKSIPPIPTSPIITAPSTKGLAPEPVSGYGCCDNLPIFVAVRQKQLFRGCDPSAITNESYLNVYRLVTRPSSEKLIWVMPCSDRAFEVDPNRSKEFRAFITNRIGLDAQELHLPYPEVMKPFSGDTATNVELSFDQKEQRLYSTKHAVSPGPDGEKKWRWESDVWQWDGRTFVPVQVTFGDECGYGERDCRNSWISTYLYRAIVREER